MLTCPSRTLGPSTIGRTGPGGRVGGRPTARLAGALVGLAVLLALAAGRADAQSLAAYATGATVPGPAGWLAMCARMPQECRAAGAETAVAADAALLDLLGRVNRRINAVMVRQEDRGADAWTVGASRGDCEDFALAKRRALLDLGVPAAALRLAVAERRPGEHHAVLTVETMAGTLVLDNLRDEVLLAAALPYRWLLLERRDRAATWSVLGETGTAFACAGCGPQG